VDPEGLVGARGVVSACRVCVADVLRPSDVVVHSASPLIDSALKPVTVAESETAKFMVTVSGEPSPTVTWYVNNVPVYNVSTT